MRKWQVAGTVLLIVSLFLNVDFWLGARGERQRAIDTAYEVTGRLQLAFNTLAMAVEHSEEDWNDPLYLAHLGKQIDLVLVLVSWADSLRGNTLGKPYVEPLRQLQDLIPLFSSYQLALHSDLSLGQLSPETKEAVLQLSADLREAGWPQFENREKSDLVQWDDLARQLRHFHELQKSRLADGNADPVTVSGNAQ